MKRQTWAFQIFTISSTLLLTLGCNDVQFQDLNEPLKKAEAPSDEFQTPQLPVAEGPAHKTGVCSEDQKISGCLKCPGLTPTVPISPQLTKAEKLADIISRGCLINNASDPKNVKIPSKDELVKRLQACTAEVYPETALNLEESLTLNDLLDPNNASFHNKIFKSLYYQPPYTDHFESYFGLETQEARKVLCFNTENLLGDLVTTEYAKECLYSEDNCRSFLGNKEKYERWDRANQIRKQLQSCLDKPYQPPQTRPTSSTPNNKQCKVETFEGHVSQGGTHFLTHLFLKGYKVSIETEESCEIVDSISDDLLENHSRVRISAYKCEE